MIGRTQKLAREGEEETRVHEINRASNFIILNEPFDWDFSWLKIKSKKKNTIPIVILIEFKESIILIAELSRLRTDER